MSYVLCFVLICLSLCQPAFPAQIRIAWDPNEEPDLAGYEVFFGDAAWNFGQSKKLGEVTTYTLTGLTQGQTYCIALKAYNEPGEESGFSNQVCSLAHDESYGEWVFDIAGKDKGGAVLQFDDIQQTFWGYGISDKLNIFGMSGNYTYDDKGLIHGTYRIYDFHNSQSTLNTGNLSGRLDNKRTTMTFQLSAFSMKGPLFLRDPLDPQYPSPPEDWTFEITWFPKAKAGFDPVKMEPYAVNGESQSHLFRFSGSEASPNPGTLDLLGVFLLTPKDKVYGVYEMSGSLSDEGYLSGSLDGSLTQFNAKSVSDNKKRYTFTGQAKE